MAVLSYATLRQHGPAVLGGLGFVAAAGIAAYKAPDPVRAGLGLAYVGLLLVMAVRDMRTLRVPNRLVFPAMGFTLGTAALLGPGAAFQALGGCFLAGFILFVVALLGRGAMGFGDVKVGAVCGAVVGLAGVVPMLAATFVAGGAFAGVMLALRLRKPKDVVAFTPFLVGATVFTLAYYRLYLWG